VKGFYMLKKATILLVSLIIFSVTADVGSAEPSTTKFIEIWGLFNKARLKLKVGEIMTVANVKEQCCLTKKSSSKDMTLTPEKTQLRLANTAVILTNNLNVFSIIADLKTSAFDLSVIEE